MLINLIVIIIVVIPASFIILKLIKIYIFEPLFIKCPYLFMKFDSIIIKGNLNSAKLKKLAEAKQYKVKEHNNFIYIFWKTKISDLFFFSPVLNQYIKFQKNDKIYKIDRYYNLWLIFLPLFISLYRIFILLNPINNILYNIIIVPLIIISYFFLFGFEYYLNKMFLSQAKEFILKSFNSAANKIQYYNKKKKIIKNFLLVFIIINSLVFSYIHLRNEFHKKIIDILNMGQISKEVDKQVNLEIYIRRLNKIKPYLGGEYYKYKLAKYYKYLNYNKEAEELFKELIKVNYQNSNIYLELATLNNSHKLSYFWGIYISYYLKKRDRQLYLDKYLALGDKDDYRYIWVKKNYKLILRN